MDIRKDLESKLRKLDVSSLSDEQAQMLSETIATFTDTNAKKKCVIINDIKETLDSSVLFQILELNPFAVSICDEEGKVLKVNKGYIELFGCEPSKTISVFDDPHIKNAGYGAELLRAKKGELISIPELWYNPQHHKPNMYSKDVCTSALLFPVKDMKGKIKNHVIIHEDITERKRTEIALNKSEEKYKQIFENIQAVYYEASIDGTLIEMSPSVELFTKYKRAELIGSNVFNIYYDIKDREKLFTDIAKKGFLNDYQMIVKDKDGAKIYCSLNCKLINDSNGNPLKIIGAIINMTPLHYSLEALKISEERYRELFEKAYDIIWTSDFEGNILSVNPLVEKILGYKYEEEVTPNIKKYLTPESYKVAMGHIGRKLSLKADHASYEVEAVAKDGHSVFLELSTFLKYKNGTPSEIFGIARDITDRKNAKEELNKTREKYKELFEGTNDIVYTMDFEGNFTSVNPMVEKMLGIKFEEITKFNLRDYITPESAVRAFENIEKKLKGEKENTVYVVDFVKKDGSYTSLEVNSMISRRNGRPVEIFGIARDITDRLKTEEELNKTRERYKELFETSNDVIYTMDFKGTITSVNQMAKKMLGYNFEELTEPNMKDYVSPETLKLAFENIAAKIKGEKLHSLYEAEFRKSDGSYITFEINSQLRYKDGVPIEIFGIARDISDRKIAEKKIQEHLSEQIILNETVNSLVSFHEKNEIYHFTGGKIYELVENAYVFVVNYNPERDSLSICDQFGLSDFIPQVGKLLGMDPYKYETVLSEMYKDELSLMKSPTLKIIPDGLFALSGRKVKKPICKTIEKILGIKAVYTVGFTCTEGIYGGLAILSKNDTWPAKTKLIETIVSQSTVALQRIFAESNLIQNEKLYRSLVNTSPDGIILFDLNGVPITANKKSYEIFGVPFESDFNMKSKNIIDFISPKDRDRLRENITSLIHGRKFYNEIYLAQHIDGTEFPIEVNSSILFDTGEKPYAQISIIRDITQRKIAEEKEKTYNQHISTLMKSATRFVELAPDGIIWSAIAENLSQLTSSKFIIVDSYNKDINELRTEVFYTDPKTKNQVLKLLGRKVVGIAFNPNDSVLSELKSKTIVKISGGIYEYAGKTIPRSICNTLEKIFKIGSIYGMGFSMNNEIFGSASLVLKEGEVIEDENILKTYMHQVSIVLQRRQAEIELKRSEEKYRTIFENAPLGIMTADRFGNIIEINPTLLQLLGSKSVEDTRNINIMGFQPLIDAGFVDAFQQCIKTGNAVISHGKYTSKSNKTFDARIYAKPLQDTDDKVSGVQVIVEDITEEKHAERKIKAALDEKEVLLREIHHRVKNNMQIIISLINMQLQESNDPLIIRQFRELQQRVRTMSIIHEDLYISEDLSKINFGNYLQKLANNLLQIYPHNFEIDLKFDISKVHLGIDAAIPCGLIVNELMSNSFKHAFPEEWISENGKKKHQVIIEFKSKGNKCFLAVGDNGIGMPSLKEAQKKNTLGLVLVEVLVNQLRGTLKMNSDNGARYEIEFGRESN